MGYQGVKAKNVNDSASVAQAILPRIGWHFKGEYRVVDYEVNLDEQAIYTAIQLGGGEVAAFVFWYALRDYDDANILFDCEWEGGYYDWVTDFYYATCPPHILDKLTPTDSVSAQNWRRACRNNWRKHHDENAL